MFLFCFDFVVFVGLSFIFVCLVIQANFKAFIVYCYTQNFLSFSEDGKQGCASCWPSCSRRLLKVISRLRSCHCMIYCLIKKERLYSLTPIPSHLEKSFMLETVNWPSVVPLASYMYMGNISQFMLKCWDDQVSFLP